MKRFHIIGKKNSGKTTLITELVSWFKKNGYQVGTIKHTHHHHELDTPGKDSYRHRESGASSVGILSPNLNAVFWSEENENRINEKKSGNRYQQFEALMSHCDFVLVEGDSGTTEMKIEVWRAENSSAPLLEDDPTITALVTDDEYPTKTLTLNRSDIELLANWVLSRLK